MPTAASSRFAGTRSTSGMRPYSPASSRYCCAARIVDRCCEPSQSSYSLRTGRQLLCLPIATQTLHATGFAMGAALENAGIAVMTYLGDGATSEGDAHEAFNFASVFQAPVVFVVQNNHFAISVPRSRQSNGRTLADR